MHLARLTAVIGIVVVSLMGGAARAADKYALDPTHTFVVFKITDLGYAHVVGWFTAVAGQHGLARANPVKSPSSPIGHGIGIATDRPVGVEAIRARCLE